MGQVKFRQSIFEGIKLQAQRAGCEKMMSARVS